MMRNALFVLIAAACFLGCDTVVELDVPRDDSQLVVNSTFSPDSTFGVRLSKSEFILDEWNPELITGASATVLDANGTEVAQLTEQEEGVYTSSVLPEPGQTYQIKVSKPGYKTATARSIVPADTAQVTRIETTKPSQSSGSVTLSLWIDDPAGKDYYEISGRSQTVIYLPDDTLRYKQKLWLRSDDPTFDNFDEGSQHDMFFNDRLFSGTKKKLTFRTNFRRPHCTSDDTECRDEHEAMLFVRKVSKEYYEYKQSVNLQDDVEGDPFAEPVPVYDNIENGLGIFAGFRENAYELNMPENQ